MTDKSEGDESAKPSDPSDGTADESEDSSGSSAPAAAPGTSDSVTFELPPQGPQFLT